MAEVEHPTTFAKWTEAHGRKGKEEWALPTLAAASDVATRADHGNHITANEYLDSPEVLREKMEIVASLLRSSKRSVMYCGAGLSKESGLRDAASQASQSGTFFL
jgi:hypothetical protein